MGRKAFLKEGFKLCSKCGNEFPETKEYFYWDSSKGTFYSKCKECFKKVKNDWQNRNREKKNEHQKNYYEKNREKELQWHRDYRKTDKYKKWEKKWKHKNKLIIYRKHNARMRFMRSLPFDLTKEKWEECKKYFNHTCAYCGKETDRLTKEHFIPVVLGGSYTVNNIISACLECNASKQHFDFFDWYPKQEFYSKDREAKIVAYLKVMKIKEEEE